MDQNLFLSAPREFVLCPSPEFHLLRTEELRFTSTELVGDDVHYILTDWRCDAVTIKLQNSGEPAREELRVYCTPVTPAYALPAPGVNSWVASSPWIYRDYYKRRGLSLVYFTEAYVGLKDSDRKYSTYVDFLRPDIVILRDCMMNAGLHVRLMNDYNDCERLELGGAGSNRLWIYFNNSVVSASGDEGTEASSWEVRRR